MCARPGPALRWRGRRDSASPAPPSPPPPGDVASFRPLLADDAVLHSDGGGKVLAFINPVAGIERLLRLYAGL